MIQYLIVAGLWIIYCATHSLIISTPVIDWIQKKFPQGHRYHRLIFNIFSMIAIIPIVGYTFMQRSEAVFRWDGNLRLVQAILILMGTILIITGATKYDFKQFLGLSQILRKNTCHSIGTDCELNMSGVLGLVRHPWYSAVMMLLWARDLDPVAILVNTILTVYIIIGTFLEEKKLLIEFGQPYRDYQSKVSMFLPIKWFKSTLNKG